MDPSILKGEPSTGKKQKVGIVGFMVETDSKEMHFILLLYSPAFCCQFFWSANAQLSHPNNYMVRRKMKQGILNISLIWKVQIS